MTMEIDNNLRAFLVCELSFPCVLTYGLHSKSSADSASPSFASIQVAQHPLTLSLSDVLS